MKADHAVTADTGSAECALRAPVRVEANFVALNEKLLQLNLSGRLQFDPPITLLEFLSI